MGTEQASELRAPDEVEFPWLTADRRSLHGQLAESTWERLKVRGGQILGPPRSRVGDFKKSCAACAPVVRACRAHSRQQTVKRLSPPHRGVFGAACQACL